MPVWCQCSVNQEPPLRHSGTEWRERYAVLVTGSATVIGSPKGGGRGRIFPKRMGISRYFHRKIPVTMAQNGTPEPRLRSSVMEPSRSAPENPVPAVCKRTELPCMGGGFAALSIAR